MHKYSDFRVYVGLASAHPNNIIIATHCMVVLLFYNYCYHYIIDDFAHIYTYAAAVAGNPSNTLEIAIGISILVGGFIFLTGLCAGAVCGTCYKKHQRNEKKK